MNHFVDDTYEEGLHEECSVLGVYDLDGEEIYGLFALSHRRMGLVNEVFDETILENLKGNIGVGHVRYSTVGASNSQNIQPLILNSPIISSPRKLIGARDPYGFRPLCIEKRENAYVLASETCALDAVGAEFVRDVKPGEIVMRVYRKI